MAHGYDGVEGRVQLARLLGACEDHAAAHKHEDFDFRFVEAVDQRRVELRLVLKTHNTVT